MLHKLKIQQKYFDPVRFGTKTFEIRRNDRGFEVGDFIQLNEIDEVSQYTGRIFLGQITYVTDFEQQEGYIVFSFKKYDINLKPVDRDGVSKRIKQLRDQKNMTLEEWSALFGSNKSAGSKWENGTVPYRKTLEKMAEISGVTVDWIRHGIYLAIEEIDL